MLQFGVNMLVLKNENIWCTDNHQVSGKLLSILGFPFFLGTNDKE
jgi:hypothetical protein